MENQDYIEDLEKRFNKFFQRSDQIWFLGAGISRDAGIPLMRKLTELVEIELGQNGDHKKYYRALKLALNDGCNVEHILDHISSLTELLQRSKVEELKVFGKEWTTDLLQELRSDTLDSIRTVISNGADPDQDEDRYQRWSYDESEVDNSQHIEFVRSVYDGITATQKNVNFFTTNYDTLLEDALAQSRILVRDGFLGGSTAFWVPPSKRLSNHTQSVHKEIANVHKLHGSIDWIRRNGNIYRARDYDRKFPVDEELLIYPQASKFDLTLRKPFDAIFSQFRQKLSRGGVLIACGYSWSDAHINRDIENALSRNDEEVALVVFVREEKYEDDSGQEKWRLPQILDKWLEKESILSSKLLIATNKGVYDGDSENPSQRTINDNFDWWRFKELTQFIRYNDINAGRS